MTAGRFSHRSGRADSRSRSPIFEKFRAKAPQKPKASKDLASLAGLGNLVKLQQQLAEERRKLQLFVIKAKQAEENKADVREDWEHEYFQAPRGETLGPSSRFVIEEELGKGVFASVFRCRRREPQGGGQPGGDCAIKLIRANPTLQKVAERELALTRRLHRLTAEKDPEGSSHLIGLVDCGSFVQGRHLALVFELMKCDCRQALRKYGQGHGLPLLSTVRNFGRNIFSGLRALRRIGVIHCDVKPDNLLMSLDKATVKLCDFGSATDVEDQVRTENVQPRYYRAPEVILGQPYNTQIDIWSAGCTLFELATSLILLNGASNNEMVHEMLKVSGRFSQRFATTGEHAARHFNTSGDFLNAMGDFRVDSVNNAVLPMETFVPPPRSMMVLLQDLVSPSQGLDVASHRMVLSHFADLVLGCLKPDPAERLTPERALQHRLFAPFAELVRAEAVAV